MAEPGPPLAPDPQLLETIQREAGVHTTAEASLQEYLQHLWTALWAWLDELGQGAGGGPVETWLLWVALALFALGLAGLVTMALRGARGRRGSRRSRGRRRQEPADRPTADPISSLELALAAGDARAALGALWAHLARTLDAQGRGRWGDDLTEREFIATVAGSDPGWEGLAELRALGREVVRGLYGPEEPELARVRALLPRAEELLGRARR